MMLEGVLTFEQHTFKVRTIAIVEFPDFKFIIKSQHFPRVCEVYQIGRGGEEEKIGESRLVDHGIGFFKKRREALEFTLGGQTIAIEYGALSSRVIYKEETKKFLFQLNLPNEEDESDEEFEPPKKRDRLEWRSFQIGDISIEHHDYESHYRIYAPNESEGLLMAFVAYRLLNPEQQ